MVLRYGRQKYDEQDLAIFFQLETHIQEIRERNEDQWNRISLSAKAIKEYSGTAMQEELISAVGAKVVFFSPDQSMTRFLTLSGSST